MTELLTAAQMRAIEAAAIASGEVTGLELMERAGRGVVEAIFEEWPELRATSHRAVVLCGPGNNGGDGFVVARLLKQWGWEVEVFLYGDPEKMPPDARVNYERWRGMGEVRRLEARLFSDAACDLIVDALFGIGLSRPIDDPELWEVLWLVDDVQDVAVDAQGFSRYGVHMPKTVAIDVPSGIDADSGREVGTTPEHGLRALRVHLTVTFHAEKIGLRLVEGADYCGKIAVVDIGLRHMSSPVSPSLFKPLVPYFKKWSQHHKYSHGHALILSGPSGRGGAARPAARGALRVGAGVVTVGCPLDAIPENAARLDAVMLRGVADGEALAGVLEDGRINALCLGPGMGTGDREAGLVGVALGLPTLSPPPPSPPHEGEGGRVGQGSSQGDQALPLLPAGPGTTQTDQALPLPRVGRGEGRGAPSQGRKLVLDADALTILSQHPDLFAALHDGCVLTPHAGEFARLFPDIAEKLAAPATKGPAYSKVDATREAAKRAGCVILYKGPDTVIADPSGRCAINSAHYDRAAPWLATAGSGDVRRGSSPGFWRGGSPPLTPPVPGHGCMWNAREASGRG